MSAKVKYLLILIVSFTGCVNSKPFQPPPPMYQSYVKEGASEEDVKHAMLECGYPNIFGANRGDGNNEIATRQNCMFRKGFKFKDGYKGICSLSGRENIEACKE